MFLYFWFLLFKTTCFNLIVQILSFVLKDVFDLIINIYFYTLTMKRYYLLYRLTYTKIFQSIIQLKDNSVKLLLLFLMVLNAIFSFLIHVNMLLLL